MEREPDGNGCGFMLAVMAVGVAILFAVAVWSRSVGR
jgi:hypothetical protein